MSQPMSGDRRGLQAFAATASECGLSAVRSTVGSSRFEGRLGDRAVVMTVRRVRATRYYGDIRMRHDLGWRFWLEIDCPSRARLVLTPGGAGTWFTRWANARLGRLQRLAMPPALAHLEAWAHDAQWGTRVLSDPSCQAAVNALAPTADAPRGTALHWQPDKIGFSTFGDLSSLGAGCGQWLAQAARLADSTTRHGMPAQAYQPHWTERHPGRLLALLLCAVVVLLVGWGVLVLVFPQAILLVYAAAAWVFYRLYQRRRRARIDRGQPLDTR